MPETTHLSTTAPCFHDANDENDERVIAMRVQDIQYAYSMRRWLERKRKLAAKAAAMTSQSIRKGN